MHVSEIVMNIACMECSNLSSVGGVFFLLDVLYVAWHRKTSWAFNDLVATISAALHKSFVCSKYAYSVSQFVLYWMRIICTIYKDFVWQLKAFLPSFCHSCACEMSSGWGHLITCMYPIVVHLQQFSPVRGNLNNNFQKPRGYSYGTRTPKCICNSYGIKSLLEIYMKFLSLFKFLVINFHESVSLFNHCSILKEKKFRGKF